MPRALGDSLSWRVFYRMELLIEADTALMKCTLQHTEANADIALHAWFARYSHRSPLGTLEPAPDWMRGPCCTIGVIADAARDLQTYHLGLQALTVLLDRTKGCWCLCRGSGPAERCVGGNSFQAGTGAECRGDSRAGTEGAGRQGTSPVESAVHTQLDA